MKIQWQYLHEWNNIKLYMYGRQYLHVRKAISTCKEGNIYMYGRQYLNVRKAISTCKEGNIYM